MTRSTREPGTSSVVVPQGEALTGQTPPRATAADPVADSFQTWLGVCTGTGWVAGTAAELVAVAAAAARVTVDPVRAVWPVPACRVAAMDGIAVQAAGTHAATPQQPLRLLPGEFELIDTGELMPAGRDAVIMREHVRHLDSGLVEIAEPVAPGRHVRPVGEDIQAGAVLLGAGHRIRPIDVAALAGAGQHAVRVRRRPIVAILPTGDEVRPAGAVLAPGEVLDTNSLMLAGMAEQAGGEAIRLPIAPDRPEEIATAVARAAQDADVVLVIAGSSAGRGDHTAAVVRRLGLVAVHGVAIRPGHPVLLGVLTGERPVPVVGVPGYPASAERAFTCFVLPLLHRLLGMGRPAEEHAVTARLACAVSSAGHLDEYLRVRLARVVDPRSGREGLVASPLRRGAGALTSMIQTEALLRIPLGTAGLEAGTEVRPIPVAGAAFDAATTIVSGPRSPAAESFLARCRQGLADGLVHWIASDAPDASEALATGLCHAAALLLDDTLIGSAAGPLAALTARLGHLAILDIARTGSTRDVLVIPATAWDSPPITVLRAALNPTG